MNKTLLHRLATIERNQPEETFFTLCKRWRDVPESRKAIAEKMDVPFVAAEYACTLGLQYGKPEDVDKLGDLRCDAVHHDGTNHYLYRVFKRGVTESQIDRLKGKILDGTATRRDITRVTNRLGDAIGKVYGWSFPREVKEHER